MRFVSQDEVDKGINCQIDWRMECIGDVSLGEKEYKINLPINIPSAAGFQCSSPTALETSLISYLTIM